MVAKAEANPAPEAAEASPDKPAAAPAAPAKSSVASWIPVIVALTLAPAGSWAVAQFVLLPKLQKELTAPLPAPGTPEPGAAAAAQEDAKAKENSPPTYEFSNVVVNLAGTMGTRYLKTSFMVTGVDGLKAAFDENKARLTDVTLNVLSSLTLNDLEEPGSKNVLREKLVTAFNQALGRKIADQVYFSDFVVQ